MENTRYAYIPSLNEGIVFSDPCYDENVWCQYRKEFQASNWLMKLTTREESNMLSFDLYIGRPTVHAGVKVSEVKGGISISCPQRYEFKDQELGIDTAHIFCGSKKNWDAFKEEASIYTAADGMFGTLLTFTTKGEQDPAGFVLLGAIDPGITNSDELFRTLTSSFDGKEISKELYDIQTNTKSMALKLAIASELQSARLSDAKQTPKAPEPPER